MAVLRRPTAFHPLQAVVALSRTDGVRLAGRVATLLLVYLALERWITGIALLPEASYWRPVLTLELAERALRPGLTPAGLFQFGILASLVVVLVLRFDKILVRWGELAPDSPLRALVLAPTLLLAWSFAAYDYNAYFDQAHLVDRTGLILLAALAAWRPVFVLPFVALAIAVIGQFYYPIGGFSVAEPFLLVRWLLIFYAYFIARAVGNRHRPADFVFLAFTLLAASYFVAGLGKIRLDWFRQGDVALLLPATYANGWLGFLRPETVGTITRRLLAVDGLFVAATFVVEVLALFCMFGRRTFRFFLVLWPLFHLAVFSLTGIFLWKWLVLEVVLLTILFVRSRAPAFEVFTRRHALLSVPLIIAGTIWFHPVNLSWYDAAVSYTYRFQAVDEDGRTHALPPRFFAPYDYQFTLGSFAYLSPNRHLQVVWGATQDRALAAEMLQARGARDVERLERDRGAVFLDTARVARMDAFLKRFIGNLNERRSRRVIPGLPAPPPHLWTFGRADYDGSAIAAVTISQVVSLFDGDRYREIGPRPLRTVDIPGNSVP